MSESSPNMKYIRRHYHPSPKAGVVYCCSSYELKACLILDNDDNVSFYETQIHFSVDGRKRIIDFLVAYKNGEKKIIEVKPIRRIVQFQEQIQDNEHYAKENGYDFEIWTEEQLGFKNDWEAKVWADGYLSKIHNLNYTKYRKDMTVKRTKKYYRKHIAQDKVEVWCNYCNATHTPLRLTHDKNIARNGRYICEKEGGHIAGQKPKKKKENPFAAENKKQCNQCQQVLPFESFGIDKTKSDGCATRCKECRAGFYREQYHERK